MLKESYYEEPTDLDRQIFEQLVPPDHFLRRVKAGIDFEAFRAEMADLYSPDMGAPADDPVRMLKLLLLAFHYDLSDRDLIAQGQVNVAFRFFLDLAMTSTLPHPTSLTKFRNRLGPERFTRLFNQVLSQARALKLVSDRLRLKDATHLIANVAVPSAVVLVAQMRERLLRLLRPFEGEWVGQQAARAELIRATTKELTDAQRLLARVEHLREIVAKGDDVVAREQARRQTEGGTGSAVAALDDALEMAHKVLSDREPKAKDQLRSLQDPDVRRGRHGAYFDGYLLDVSVDADSELITAVDVLAANADEAADTKALIESEEAAHGNDVACVSIDSIGYRGDVLDALTDAETGPRVAVVVPPYDRNARTGSRIRGEVFDLDEARGVLRCPGGQETRTATRSKTSAGVIYSFTRGQCQACPLRPQCLGAEAKVARRTVFKSEYERPLVRAREVARTPDYDAVRREHPRVERKLADMIRYHGGRRVRYRRLNRVRVQYVLTAMVVNIKRIVNVLLPRLEAQTA